MIQYIFLAISVFLSLLYGSWIIVLLLPRKQVKDQNYVPPLSILLPSHNEEKNIESSVRSIINAQYPSKKEIIVINNGSRDRTSEIVRGLAKKYKNVRLFNLGHIGKSASLNYGTKKAKFDIIVTLDADSSISEDSLINLVQPLADEKIAGVSGIVRAKKSRNPFTWFQDFEYIISSGWRYMCTKINANSYLPGFSAFKKKAFLEVGGFKTDTLTEDVDIVVDLKKHSYDTVTVKDAVMYTEVPGNLKAFVKQRFRWGRGNIQVMRKHSKFLLSKRSGLLGKFSFPTHAYWYIHALLYIPIILYMMLGDYLKYFVLKNNFISFSVFKYFFSWLSLFGMVETFANLSIGIYTLNIFLLATIIVFTLSTVFNIYSLSRMTKPHWQHLVAFFFFPLYVLLNLSIWGFSFIYEMSNHKVVNKWTK